MRRVRLIFPLLFISARLMVGCMTANPQPVVQTIGPATPEPPTCPGEVCFAKNAKIITQTDQFSKTIELTGLRMFAAPLGGENWRTRTNVYWYVRSWVDKDTHAALHQLYVEIAYSGDSWHFYESAADEQATSHPVVIINRSVSDCERGAAYSLCDYSETVGVDIDDTFLRSHADGFRIKFLGRHGPDFVLVTPAEAVAKQVAALDSLGAVSSGPSEPTAKGPKIGIRMAPTPPAIAKIVQLDRARGLFVAVVEKNGAAEKAGIEPGDIILECHGRPTDTPADIHAVLADERPNSTVSCKLWSKSGSQDNKPLYSEKVISIKLGSP
jgi:PDZ domain-containing protein